jgi:hypothetical protein
MTDSENATVRVDEARIRLLESSIVDVHPSGTSIRQRGLPAS